MNTPTDSREAWDQRVEVLSSADDSAFAELAIPERNAILDTIRRREENLQALAEYYAGHECVDTSTDVL